MEKEKNMGTIQFLNRDGDFRIEQPEDYSYLYFPVAGEDGIKSSLTPNLGGDIKMGQNAFLMEPVSAENLHNNRSSRNFWCYVDYIGAWSATGASAEAEARKYTEFQDQSVLEAGFMWQSVTRKSERFPLEAKITSFVPLGHNVEIMYVELTNKGRMAQKVTPTAAIPMYGRSADNIRDHRHVTSLLHEIRTTDRGVYVKPALSFDERGHQRNELTYFVCGVTGTGEKPEDFYPTAEGFVGEGGNYCHPHAVLMNETGIPSGNCIRGKEAVGGIRFPAITLHSEERASYIVIMGITGNEEEIDGILSRFSNEEKVKRALQEMKDYWQGKVNVRYYTGDGCFDNYMRWVSFQPILRRLYGCSFLPHHDYGRGGRGWRDLWQDCLSLLIMDPGGVRQMILDNYGGVRIDGTNATIIGGKQGEFIADRNGIARVWMDHGVWPFMTTKLYIDQTGDIEILREKVCYFKDEQKDRGSSLDELWDARYGTRQKCGSGELYEGSVLEHLLLQHLCAFYEVGEHNQIRLRGADWNDALDMAEERGESVAFTCAYAGNLMGLAELLEILERQFGWKQLELLEEMRILLEGDSELYGNVAEKQSILGRYLASCGHEVSGRKMQVPIRQLAQNLRQKAEWMQGHIRETEWISSHQAEGWFNSYYDNDGKRVEGYFQNGVRMMLTGQVFAIMSNTAEDAQVEKICKSADRYLYHKDIGGYRLNTDFHEQNFRLGRMFSFAYGEKENGAVFSHMTVMYANALYQRGFVREGYKALQTLADTALHFETSRIYPGIPEYFNGEGRGLYHYLTGAASWYMLTFVTEVFGVRGEIGDLAICPKLLSEQFDSEGNAEICLRFADKDFRIAFHNPEKLTYGEYVVGKAVCDGKKELFRHGNGVRLALQDVTSLSDGRHDIDIELHR